MASSSGLANAMKPIAKPAVKSLDAWDTFPSDDEEEEQEPLPRKKTMHNKTATAAVKVK